MIRLVLPRVHLGAQRVAILCGSGLKVGDRDGDMVQTSNHGQFSTGHIPRVMRSRRRLGKGPGDREARKCGKCRGLYQLLGKPGAYWRNLAARDHHAAESFPPARPRAPLGGIVVWPVSCGAFLGRMGGGIAPARHNDLGRRRQPLCLRSVAPHGAAGGGTVAAGRND